MFKVILVLVAVWSTTDGEVIVRQRQDASTGTFATLSECRDALKAGDPEIYAETGQKLRKFIQEQPDLGVLLRGTMRFRCAKFPTPPLSGPIVE